LVLAFALLAALAGQATATERIVSITVDEARLMRLPEQVATLVVGNPLIADASLQPGGTMVLTGKAYGRTNLVALDRNGNVLMERVLQVQGPSETVVVYRGTARQTYSCTPRCERRIMLGDADEAFSAALTQSTTLATQASGAAR
jgi:Flp pilus assembly secretin CpaC